MEDTITFDKFDDYISRYFQIMEDFDNKKAKEFWENDTHDGENHYWNKYLECNEDIFEFYSRLDIGNRITIFSNISSDEENYKDFREFNFCLQKYIRFMYKFSYSDARNIFPFHNKEDSNYIWSSYNYCDRKCGVFYSRLNTDDLKKLFKAIMCKNS